MDAQYGNYKEEIAKKFEQLLDLSRQPNSSAEMNSDQIHQEILDFVLDNVNISKVLEEHSQDVLLSKDLTQMTEDVCIEHFNTIARSTGTPFSVVASQILAQQLFNVTVVNQEQNKNSGQKLHHLLPDEAKQKVNVLLGIINKIKDKGTDCFDKVNLIKSLPYKDIPMELVWLLDKNSVVSFRTCFLSWFADEAWLENFYETVVFLCCDEREDNIALRERMLQVFVGELLVISYEEAPSNREINEKTQQILFKAIKYIEDKSERLTSEQTRKSWLCIYEVIRGLKDVPSEIIHSFFQDILSDFLIKPSIKIEDALVCQDKWTLEFLSEATKTKYLQFVLVLGSKEIIQIVQHAVESIKSELVNFQVLCNLLTVFLVHTEEAYKPFDDVLTECLLECLENCDVLQFHLILLLRRQAALEGSHVSPAYSTWFEVTLVEQTFVKKDSSFGLNTKKTIHFFLKSLTELVPYDKPEFLKVHIFKCPQVPSKFKYYVDDFVSLAKTRLADLKVPLEENTGLFTQGSSNDEHVKVMEQARADVEKCLLLYEQSGRVPSTIMEASIFRKPYFIGRFLPALLVPRNLPQEPDIRMRLIDELNRAGKIPSALIKSYTRKCEHFEDFPNDDKPRNNIQQLDDCMEKLPNLLVVMATSDDASKELQSWLSTVSRKLKLIFGTSSQENVADIIDLDVAALNINNDYIQASYIVINIFCRACVAVQNTCTSETVSLERLSKFRWASKFVSILVSFPNLITSLYVHLWSTIFHEPQLLTQEHIHGLAIFICHLSCFKTSCKIRLHTTTKAEGDCDSTFVGFISNQISLSSRGSALFYLRWCCYYLQYAMFVFPNLTTDVTQLSSNGQPGFAYVPKTMLMKMEYLFNKLKYRTIERNDITFLDRKEIEILSLLIQSLRDVKLVQERSFVSVKQWLVWELNIHEDILLENERQQYYNWIMYENFMLISRDENDSDPISYQEIATEIVSSLLDYWTSSERMDSGNTRSSTEMNLIKILQDIVSYIGLSMRTEEACETVWFLECFASRFNKIKRDKNPSSEIELRCEIMAFVRLVTQLPTWLLIANSDWETLNGENTIKLSQFLNEHLKPCSFRPSLVLPFDFTAHILKIFSKNLKSRDKSLRVNEEAFRCFIADTPFVFGSLMYYWIQLKSIYNLYMTTSETLQELQSYNVWLTSIFTIVEQPSKHHLSSLNLPCKEVGQSYAIFLRLLKSCRVQSTDLEVVDFIQSLNNILDRILAWQPGKNLMIYVYDNIMAYLTTTLCQENEMKSHDKHWFEISTAILFRSPDVLRVFTQELNKDPELLTARSLLFEAETYRLISLVFFRIVMLQDRNTLQHKLPAEHFTLAVLLMYIEFKVLYDQSCSVDSGFSKELIDLDLFVKITIFVKEHLNYVPSSVLEEVPKLVVAKLPKEVQRYF